MRKQGARDATEPLTKAVRVPNHSPMTAHDLIKVDDWTGPGQLWRLKSASMIGTPVLITHGTFSNADTCLPMAQFFGQSAPTYVIEWRARDLKRGNVTRFDYHDLAEGEMCAAITDLALRYPDKGVHIVAHSGGGLAMVLACLHVPEVTKMVRSMTLLGAQATHSHLAPKRVQMFMKVMGYLGTWLGYWPARYVRLGPCSEANGIMKNWAQWNRSRQFSDRLGRDVIPQLAGVKVPTLVLAGAADTFIAPSEGCREIANGFGPNATFEICGRAQGYSEDFNHARLIRSRAAAASLWPRIAEWMAQH